MTQIVLLAMFVVLNLALFLQGRHHFRSGERSYKNAFGYYERARHLLEQALDETRRGRAR